MRPSESRSAQALIVPLLCQTLALLMVANSVAAAAAAASVTESRMDDANYWKQRREWFHNRTKFDLTEDNLRLYGSRRLMYRNRAAEPKGHLPFWFDYELFKAVFHKVPKDAEEDRARHEVYINTCLRVLKVRVLFRMLAGFEDTFITSDADRFHHELFEPVQSDDPDGHDANEIAFAVRSEIAKPGAGAEDPLDKAIRLVRHEMEIVESRNQVETNLKAFDEFDGSAIKGKLPY